MTIIEKNAAETSSVIVSPVVFRDNQFETALLYTRADEKQVNMVLVHVGSTESPKLALALYDVQDHPVADNPTWVQEEGVIPQETALVELGMEEARYLRAFLNCPEVTAYLGIE